MIRIRGFGLLVALFVFATVALIATSVSSQHLDFEKTTRGLVGVTELPISMSGPTAVLREDDPLPGAPGETADSMNNPVVNHIGGYGLTVNSTGSGSTLSNVWGNASGGPGAVIITEGTYGNLTQTSFESFHGLSDAGMPAYSASSDNSDTGTTGLDGVWLSMSVVLNEEDPVASLPGQFSTFNSRPGVTALGQPYWVGGIADSAKASTQNRVLFFGVGASPVLMGGDSIVGVPELVETGSSNIDFDYRYSQFGTNYLTPVLVDSSTTDDGVVVSNGAAVLVGGMIVREASPVPASAGGLLDENWDNFDFMGVNEAGVMFFTGDTDADTSMDEFVLLGDQIILREGAVLTPPAGSFTVSGSIEGGYLNEQTDWAVIWDVDNDLGENVEALIFNGELVLKEGDEVDFDGDGVPDVGATISGFTGISTLVVGDRQEDGIASVYFTADVDTAGTPSTTDDTEIFYCLEFQFEVIPPDDEDEDEDGDETDDASSPTSVRPEFSFDRESDDAGNDEVDASSGRARMQRHRGLAGTAQSEARPAGPAAFAKATGTLKARLDAARKQVLRLGFDGGTELRRHVERLLDEAESTGDELMTEEAENVLRLLYDRIER
jgi:hypothetical protein